MGLAVPFLFCFREDMGWVSGRFWEGILIDGICLTRVGLSGGGGWGLELGGCEEMGLGNRINAQKCVWNIGKMVE